jgi:PAS domain S-box-containing protein
MPLTAGSSLRPPGAKGNEDIHMIDKKENDADRALLLRKRAEEMEREKTAGVPESIKNLSSVEAQSVLHELRAHQIELEMQNDELRASQAEIEAARVRYFDLYNLAPAGYFTVSEQGVILESNLTAALMLNSPGNSLKGRPFSQFILNEDRDIYHLKHRQLLKSGEMQALDLRILKQDGSPFWARLDATVTKADGAATVIRVVISDISERKQAELEREKTLTYQQGISLAQKSLLAPAPLYQKLKSVTDNVVQIFDADFCRIWLIRPGDLCERGCIHAEATEGPHICRYRNKCLHLITSSGRYTHVDGKDHRRVPFGCYKIGRIASGQNHKFLTNDVTNDPLVHNHSWARELGLLSFVGYQLCSPDGDVIGVIAIFAKHPITPVEDAMLDSFSKYISQIVHQCEKDEKLIASEIRYRRLFESAKDGILLLDYDTGVIIDVNPFLTNLTGWTHEEFLGRHLWDIGFSKDTRLSKISFLQLQAQNYTRYEDLPLETKDGKTVDVEFINNVYQVDGKKVIQCNIRDITEHKHLEAEKSRLEEQNRQLLKAESLGLMSGAIAHHFNNKLNVVMGYLEMVIGDLPPGESHSVKLAKAMQAAQKASEVSGNLLAYLGQIRNKIESLELSEICTVSLPVLLAGMPKNVALETDLPSPGPYIGADAKQIQKILTSLVINAWEAIGEETGTVRLSVKTVPAADIPVYHRPLEWQAREQSYACLEVADSGCGILGKDMEKIFDPFFSTKFTGRGLGLPVVLGIVKTHEAVITVENRIGGGSVFKVFFPLAKQIPFRPPDQIAKAPEIVAGGTVLLVEDEAALREMTRLALVHFGFTVLQAKDGIEAVEIFGQHKDEISCVLSDLTMPRMGGWETISALRALRHDLPVILASGYDEATVMKGEHPELPDFFLNKPYDINKLRDTIGKAIARKC